MQPEMTMRDHFAAAVLTGLLAQGDDGSFSEEFYVRAAYRWADAMLRCRAGGDCPGQDNAPNLDAAPAARAGTPGTGGTQEPVAWAVEDKDGVFDVDLSFSLMEGRCVAFSKHGPASIIPLYRQPQPTLTDAEREAVEQAIDAASGMAPAEPWAIDTLRNMLERLK